MKRRSVWIPGIVFALCLYGASTAHGDDRDTDGDGLTDYHELHKYRTDPSKKDTAGQGVRDGDANQRREFSYSIRSVLRVMPPYNLKAMNDDYQDVRVLAETKDYVELEVISYPFNTNAAAIYGNPNWKKDYAGMQEYLRPGITTNWDEKMQQEILRELVAAGIDLERLTDREVVEQVSRWLFARGKYRYMFGTFYVHFPDGKPALFPGTENAFEREKGDKAWTPAQQFAHELLGRDMYANKCYGTCTSAATYQCTVLRAIGIPTRMVLAIPLIDASDEAQVQMVEKGLTNHQVRGAVLRGLRAVGSSFSSHTFCEVYVGHRWRRLNYNTLGQNILDPSAFGLMVHVHTFRDLSEANLAPTWGRRYGLGQRDEVFKHSNPYRALEVSDHFGRWCKFANPASQDKEHHHLTLSKAYWIDSKQTPAFIRESWAKQPADDAGHLLVHADEWFENAGDYLQYKPFMKRVDRKFLFKAEGHPDVKGVLTTSFWTLASENVREFEIAIPREEFAKMVKGVAYTIHPVNATPHDQWRARPGLTITRE